MDSIAGVESDLEAWREAHKHLSHAVLVAKEAVDVAKAQRRYWLEEIEANLTPEGKLVSSSSWRKPVSAKKSAVKKRSAKPAKRKVADDDTVTEDETTPKAVVKPKTTKKRKKPDEGAAASAKKKKLKITLKKTVKTNAQSESTGEAEHDDVHEPSDSDIPTAYSGHMDTMPPAWDAHHHHSRQLRVPPGAFAAAGPPIHHPPMPPAHPYPMMHHVPEQLRPFLTQSGLGGVVPQSHIPMGPQPTYPNAYATVLQHGNESDEDSESE